MIQQVMRYFTIKEETFYMYSKISGEFGDQLLVTTATGSLIAQAPGEGSSPLDFNFRLGEMNYFLQVYSMFNPQNKMDYGLQETPSES